MCNLLRRILVGSAITCAAFFLVPFATAQTKVNIGYSASTSWTGAFIAKDQGFFEKRSIDAELTFVAVSPSIPPSLISGSLQIGGLASPDVLHAVDNGIDLVILGGALVNLGKAATGPSSGGVFAQTGTSVHEPRDFVGKKVGVPGIGTALDIGFRQYLMKNGVDLKSVTFVEVPFPQGADALKGKRVDAVVSNSPFAGRILETQSGYLAIDYTRQMDAAIQTTWVATRDWVAQHWDAARAFRDALKEAWDFEQRNPDAAKASIAKWTKLPPAAQASIVLPTLKPVIQPADLTFWVNAMVDQGLIKSGPDLSKVIME
jgi:NitT/TauT family transport system substrate-binding protein